MLANEQSFKGPKLEIATTDSSIGQFSLRGDGLVVEETRKNPKNNLSCPSFRTQKTVSFGKEK